MCNAHENAAPLIFEKTLAVNLSAPFYLTQAAIPHLLQAQGSVVNVTSSGRLRGRGLRGGLLCNQGGPQTHLTKALAMEYMHQPIRFNAVAPGGMRTNIGNTIRMPEGVDYSLVKRYTGLRGLVEIEDVAEMIAYLASDAGRSA